MKQATSDLITVEISVSIEDPGYFATILPAMGFDEYEYAVNQAYDFIKVGGIDCLEAEGDYWGSPCLRVFSRRGGRGSNRFHRDHR